MNRKKLKKLKKYRFFVKENPWYYVEGEGSTIREAKTDVERIFPIFFTSRESDFSYNGTYEVVE